MHILITGGTGLLGTALTEYWLEQGHQVTFLTRRPQRVHALWQGQVRALTTLSPKQPDPPYDAIINLAGAPIADRPWSQSRQAILRSSRVTFTQQLAESLSHWTRPPSVLLSASAIGIYGALSPIITMDEATQAGHDFAAQLCRDWENAASMVPAGRCCHLRTGLVLSPAGGILQRLILPAGWGIQMGAGTQGFSWIHISDWVSAVDWLLHHSAAQGPYNLTAPHPVSIMAFMEQLQRSQHIRQTLKLPVTLVKALFGRRAALLLEGPRVLPQRLLQAGFAFQYPDLESALPVLLPR
ncbi:TIGR01777 family oxidoreductase [Ferrovum myxofaciens]|uniref:TIGR01777 family oxidoreductase n=1 Tax=Ferrovum myxofaciens TaxID=416213 RepID=UPI003EB86A31